MMGRASPGGNENFSQRTFSFYYEEIPGGEGGSGLRHPADLLARRTGDKISFWQTCPPFFGDWVMPSRVEPPSEWLTAPEKEIQNFVYVSRQTRNPGRLTLSADSLVGLGLSKFIEKPFF
jgi:hypothetical protein